MKTDLAKLEAEQALRAKIATVRERLMGYSTGRNRQLDLELSVALHAELAALEEGPDPRKAAEDAAALQRSQTWLEEKRGVVAQREKLKAILHAPTSLPDDRKAAAEALAALPRAW